MRFTDRLERTTLVRRYKRFLADVRTADGRELTVFCPNTGSMRNCVYPGYPAWLSRSDRPGRKYPHTWEIAEDADGHRIGINTGRANSLVAEALRDGVIGGLDNYPEIRAEQSFGREGSRVDFLLQGDGAPCYVEVKSVTLHEGEGRGFFPDAVTARGLKHLRELVHVRESGARAVLVFCVQHSAIRSVAPADHIDPRYGEALRHAVNSGVEVIALAARPDPAGYAIGEHLPVHLDAAQSGTSQT